MTQRAVEVEGPQVGPEVVLGRGAVEDQVEAVARRGHVRLVGRHHDPVGAERAGVVRLVGGPREDGDLGAERDGELDRQVAEAPEPDHPDPRAGPDVPAPQRLPHGDAGAHQRSDGGGVEPGRAVVDEAVADDVRRGPPAQRGRAVDPVATAVREGREVDAHVLVAGPAHAALAAGVDDVADGDRVADREARDVRADGRDLADELVPGHEGHAAASLRGTAAGRAGRCGRPRSG